MSLGRKDSSGICCPGSGTQGPLLFSDFHLISYILVFRCGLHICAAVRVGSALALGRKLTQMTFFLFPPLKAEKDDLCAVIYSHVIKSI